MPDFLAEKMAKIKAEGNESSDAIIECHLYGIAGDWYISEISEDKETAFGFQVVNAEPAWEMEEWLTNCKKWGPINIKRLQELVNTKFLVEKDIRFLISRDIHWKPVQFSSIDINKHSLYYPGPSTRYPSS